MLNTRLDTSVSQQYDCNVSMVDGVHGVYSSDGCGSKYDSKCLNHALRSATHLGKQILNMNHTCGGFIRRGSLMPADGERDCLLPWVMTQIELIHNKNCNFKLTGTRFKTFSLLCSCDGWLFGCWKILGYNWFVPFNSNPSPATRPSHPVPLPLTWQRR